MNSLNLILITFLVYTIFSKKIPPEKSRFFGISIRCNDTELYKYIWRANYI